MNNHFLIFKYLSAVKRIFWCSFVCLLWSIQNFSYAEESSIEFNSREAITVFALGARTAGQAARGGEHSVTQAFVVESKSARVNLSCKVSNLVLNGEEASKREGTSKTLHPNTYRGCLIEVPNGASTIGAAQQRSVNFNAAKQDGMYTTDYVTFQSLDGKPFKEDVYITVYWQEDSGSGRMQFSGEYKGEVLLLATVPNQLTEPQ